MRFIKLQNLEERLASLELWQNSEKEKFNLEEFAKAGFFFEHSFDIHDDPGRLRCAFCPAVIGNWQPDDDPWKEHILSVDFCPHVVRYKGEDFVDMVNQEEKKMEDDMEDQYEDQDWEHYGHFSLSGLLPSRVMRHEQKAGSSSTNLKSVFNPDMNSTDARLASFDGLRHNTVNNNPMIHLADSGFYFEGSDVHGVRVRCFCCGHALCNVDENDDVWRIHAQMSDCEHVERRKGVEFILQARGNDTFNRNSQDIEMAPDIQTRKRKESADRLEPETSKKLCKRRAAQTGQQNDTKRMHASRLRSDVYWHKDRWFKVQWRPGRKQSRIKRACDVNRQPNAGDGGDDGDMDWGGERNGDETVFLCCGMKVCRCNGGRGPCPVCLLDR